MTQPELFDNSERRYGVPLAEKMRPRAPGELVGLEEVLGRKEREQLLQPGSRLPSMILHGPPGSGKTTFAELLGQRPDYLFETLQAVLSGVKELRSIRERAEASASQTPTLLFVDEIHRWTKSQQDVLLPCIERGQLTLIGATTENPAYVLTRALLSRCRILRFKALSQQAVEKILSRAWPYAADADTPAWPELIGCLAKWTDGDARRALLALERIAPHVSDVPGEDAETLCRRILEKKVPAHDRDGEAHYDLTSAWIKSMRASDPNAALYYLARMLEGGEDPRFLFRRMLIFGAEDVGHAQPGALAVVTAALHAFEVTGLPEGELHLAHATTYLACAKKSRNVCEGWAAARQAVREHGNLPIPLHLLNRTQEGSPRRHGAAGRSAEGALPETLKGTVFFKPSGQ